MSEWNPPIWVRFSDGKVDRRGPVHGYVPRGRGRRAKIVAIVQVKNRLVDVLLADIKVISAPKKTKRG